jgi:hypothetical protein
MWIPVHRISDEEIESLDRKELERQHRMHSTLWVEFKSKPTAPKICLSCGIETSKYENHILNHLGVMEWYNEECRECMTNNY